MLCLSRKRTEAIRIGDGESAVEVIVLSIHNGHVKLGIAGPESTVVMRTELLEPKEPRR